MISVRSVTLASLCLCPANPGPHFEPILLNNVSLNGFSGNTWSLLQTLLLKLKYIRRKYFEWKVKTKIFVNCKAPSTQQLLFHLIIIKLKQGKHNRGGRYKVSKVLHGYLHNSTLGLLMGKTKEENITERQKMFSDKGKKKPTKHLG